VEFEFRETPLRGVVVIKPKFVYDERGFFMETYHAERFRDAGIELPFVQDNHSRSARGVLRGLHYQEPQPQGKLVRCTRGALFDVAVDIRKGSPTFGKWFGLELSGTNRLMMWVPPGFAHGFCALEDGSDLVYKCTALYSPGDERVIRWDDADIGIEWPLLESPVLSDRDAAAPPLKDAVVLPRFEGNAPAIPAVSEVPTDAGS